MSRSLFSQNSIIAPAFKNTDPLSIQDYWFVYTDNHLMTEKPKYSFFTLIVLSKEALANWLLSFGFMTICMT